MINAIKELSQTNFFQSLITLIVVILWGIALFFKIEVLDQISPILLLVLGFWFRGIEIGQAIAQKDSVINSQSEQLDILSFRNNALSAQVDDLTENKR